MKVSRLAHNLHLNKSTEKMFCSLNKRFSKISWNNKEHNQVKYGEEKQNETWGY
jgi:hypothetical protein